MPSDKFSTISRYCRLVCLLGAACTAFFSGTLRAQTSHKKSSGGQGNPEQRTARAYEATRANPLELHAFLVRMPKGADLHYHLSGGIYAESFIRAAAEDGLCIDLASHSFVKPAGAMPSEPPQPLCGVGKVPAAKAVTDQNLYDALADALS